MDIDTTPRFSLPQPIYGQKGETYANDFADAMDLADTKIGDEIDGHTGDTSNPHAVTAAQVGLGNVTNDAQLKRADNDWSGFGEEGSPEGGDLLLIEKGASGEKKKVQITNLPFGTGTGGEGEANTASNQGQSGVGLYLTKVDVDLQFKNISAGSTKITVVDNPTTKEVEIDVDEDNLTITPTQAGLSNVTNDAQMKRAAGDINTFTAKAAPVGADLVLLEDSAASWAKKKATLTSLPVGKIRRLDYTALTDNDYSGDVLGGVAGETLAQFEAVYLKSDGKWYKAKADTVTNCPAYGLVLAAAVQNDPVDILLDGVLRDDGGGALTVGGPIYLSPATAGALTSTVPSTSGHQVQILGYALSAYVRLIKINLVTVEIA